MTEDELAAAEARRLRAHEMVCDLDQGRRQWLMSIPVQVNYDPDMVIEASLADVNRLTTEVRNLQQALAERTRASAADRPTVVCLCGSTRFYTAYQEANYRETMAGRIVLTVGFYPHSASQAHGEGVGATAQEKAALDALHLEKVRLADEILVLNVGGYVGDSTRREIAYAAALGKPIRWLAPLLASGEDDVERLPL